MKRKGPSTPLGIERQGSEGCWLATRWFPVIQSQKLASGMCQVVQTRTQRWAVTAGGDAGLLRVPVCYLRPHERAL